jgi:hypothetical protein
MASARAFVRYGIGAPEREHRIPLVRVGRLGPMIKTLGHLII